MDINKQDLTPPPWDDPGSRARIRRLSAWMRWMSATGALTLLLLPPVFWSQQGWVRAVATSNWGVGEFNTGAAARLAGLLGCLPQMIVGLWAMWEIWSLFGCYGRGTLLTAQPARHLHRLGRALIVLAVAMPLSDTLVALALTWQNAPGHRQLVLNFSGQDYMALLFGLMLLALATVLREAARVAQEHAEFV